jgi:poly(A) polymerase
MDLAGLNAQFFQSSTDRLILQIFIILKNYSANNFFVGGCVRDDLLGRKPKDYDIVTDIPMDLLEAVFTGAGWRVTGAGKAFLVLNVSKGHQQFEIASFRKETNYDGRRPQSVDIGTMQEDAHRRDFTVNALYKNPWTGEIIDPTGQGKRDLADRVLRFIGDPRDRIKEDRLRVFRFYRFLTKGFKPDKKSLQVCRTMFGESYKQTTPERVREELEKMTKI